MNVFTFNQRDLKGLRVLIRTDLNLPVNDSGEWGSTARLEAALPTIKAALNAQAYVMVMSHFRRPKEGVFDANASLARLVKPLSDALKIPVDFVSDYLEHPPRPEKNRLMLLENVRFNVGESEDDPELARRYAELCDLFVMDAYAVAHRKQASVSGICEYAPAVMAGALLEQEIAAMKKIHEPERPLLVILGGSKLSTKLPIIKNLAPMTDQFIFGGGIANTFLAAQGFEIGQSLYEKDFIEEARKLLKEIRITPIRDVVVSHSDEAGQRVFRTKKINEIEPFDEIGDLGPETLHCSLGQFAASKTIIWNGPIGKFEWKELELGTHYFVRSIAHARAFSLAGGGETVAAIERFSEGHDRFSYCSTGGGAFLTHLAGLPMPGLEALRDRT